MKQIDSKLLRVIQTAMLQWKSYAEKNKVDRDLEIDTDFEARQYQKSLEILKEYEIIK